MIVPPDTLSDEDVERLRQNELCVIIAADPAALRFLDPIPAASQRGKMESAAIELSRRILHGQVTGTNLVSRDEAAKLFMLLLTKGTSLGKVTIQEEYERIFTEEKEMEIRRLAREEAKAERAAKKASSSKPKTA